ncbi:undecaprenyl-diphosphatase [Scopulibacillus daqui]|uniref:Undecaprenyl-diphosphatase n=1 Tax=Scopulibacillus daqui TaxID=1469162 RepID=A0ABS2PVL7_9BACL|nr:phosphatase PAP2 family protein [Scopulibacillus daqui]MBM7643926.1 undecaprenyl-diphosphatase [Scopulibacillus daqui]
MNTADMRKSIISCLCLVIVFCVLGYLTTVSWFIDFDKQLLNLLNGVRFPAVIDFFKFMTLMGSTKVIFPVVVIAIIFLLFLRRSVSAVAVLFGFFGVRLLNIVLKGVFMRERPSGHHYVEASGYSFPSGHTMNAIGVYGIIAYVLYRILKNQTLKWAAAVIFMLLILLIGLSRPILGVHYFSDIAAGYTAGGIWLIMMTMIVKKYEKERAIEH